MNQRLANAAVAALVQDPAPAFGAWSGRTPSTGRLCRAMCQRLMPLCACPLVVVFVLVLFFFVFSCDRFVVVYEVRFIFHRPLSCPVFIFATQAFFIF